MKIIKKGSTTEIHPYFSNDEELELMDVIIVYHELGIAEINAPVESLRPVDIEQLIKALQKASEIIIGAAPPASE